MEPTRNLEAQEQQEEARYEPFDAAGLPGPTQQRPEYTVPVAQTPKVVYLELDGVIPLTRQERTGQELSPADRRRQ